MSTVWEAVEQGRHCVVIGELPPAPPDSAPIQVDCAAARQPLGPLLILRARAGDRKLIDLARRRVRAGLRRRLLGEEPEPEQGGSFVEGVNRLADSGASAIVFDSIEQADDATLRWLAQAVAHPGWLRLPLVLVQHRPDDRELWAEVAAAVKGAGGAVLESQTEDGDPSEAPVISGLPADTLRVLRAAALCGPGFDCAVVARLLDVDELLVLEHLQHAHDAGVRLDDLGAGQFRLDPRLEAALSDGLLPSLASAWHRRLAEIHGERDTDPAPPPSPQEAAAVEAAVEAPSADLREPIRAAQHAEAAGDRDKAVEQYVAGAERAFALGAYPDALELVRRALSMLGAEPRGARRQLQVRALVTLARIQWRAVGPSELFSLPAAVETLEQAQATLSDSDPAALRASVCSLLATVLYDVGTQDALERALRALDDASRTLLDAGKPVDAARLLNDQAAVWVRIGDVVRANHLLKRSRELFTELAPDNPVARLELAETEHLLARLLLHVEARPGHEGDAIRIGVEHALVAEEIYTELGHELELARVWETLGRLEARRGRSEQALERLSQAANAQRELGDVLGLARSTAAVSDLLRAAQRPHDAVSLLAQSIALNLDKGSPVGLAFNREALERLVQSLEREEREQLQPILTGLREKLDAAEEILGRAELPPSAHVGLG